MSGAQELRAALTAAASRRGPYAAQFLGALQGVRSRSGLLLLAERMAAALVSAGKPEDALDVLAPALASGADDPRLCWQASRALQSLNRFRDALPYLRRHYEQTGQGLWEYLVSLAHCAEYEEILARAPAVEAAAGPARRPIGGFQHVALARLSLLYDRAAVADRVRAHETGADWLDTEGVLAAIRAAQVARSPFSLVRLGDGEARFVTFFDEEAAALLDGPELTAMIDSIWVNWFGAPIATFAPADVQRLSELLADAIENATVLGIPDTGHVLADHYHYGYQAVMLKYLLPPQPGQRLTSAFVHLRLHHRTPFLREIVAGQDFLGFVGCHPGLAARLAERFRVGAHAEYIVPGEIGQAALPNTTRVGGHFPEAFDRVLGTLAVPAPGALFLVAAGLLGKVYCERIRALGGIAIDIGSAADGWMGFNTRPGNLGDIAGWSLEANPA